MSKSSFINHQQKLTILTPTTLSQVKDVQQCAANQVKQNPQLLKQCEVQHQYSSEMEKQLAQLLLVQLQSVGLFSAKGQPCSINNPSTCKIASGNNQAFTHDFDRWMAQSCRQLVSHGLLKTTADDDGVYQATTKPLDAQKIWQQWDKSKIQWAEQGYLGAHAHLAQVMLKALTGIISGKVQATDVMFKDSSYALVEGIYRRNPKYDLFNGMIGDAVEGLLNARGYNKSSQSIDKPLRFLEIGAGTGGTSSQIFKRLLNYPGAVEEYRYTDLSVAFLKGAQQQFGTDHPYLVTSLFNAENPVAAQGLNIGDYDLIIAANVLHATKNIRQTLRNTKALLKANGLLLLNEMSNCGGLFAHLTFGMTEGWWRYQDSSLRIEGSPAISPQHWHQALKSEGFNQVYFPAEPQHHFDLQVIVAQSDGMVRQPDVELSKSTVTAKPKNKPKPQKHSTVVTSNKAVSQNQLRQWIKGCVIDELCDGLMLSPDGVNSEQSFSDYGLDSIVGVSLIKKLNQRLAIALETTCFYDYSNVVSLSDFILSEYQAHLMTSWQQSNASNENSQVTIENSAPTINKAPSFSDQSQASSQASKQASKQVNNQAFNKDEQQRPQIAVIGMSGQFAQSENLDQLWDNLAAGKDLVTTFPARSDSERLAQQQFGDDVIYGGFMARVDEFDALFFSISAIEARYMDPQQRLFLQTAWCALEDAGYAGNAIEGSQCGVYVGCSSGDYANLFDDGRPVQSLWGNLSSVVAARISYYMNLRGPAVVIDTACSSSLVAINQACQSLANGEVEYALAGGVFALTTSHYYRSLKNAGMFSLTGRCYTFDARADGFIPGEGAGAVMLKRLDRAVNDGDHIHGIIVGSGVNQDGASNGITAPSALSQESLERQIYADFDIDPSHIQMVEAHGTGTILGDPIEHRALMRSFRHYSDKKHFCALGSLKSNLGHTQGAAGIAGVLKVLLCLQHQKLVPSIHFEQPNPNIDFEHSPFYVNTELKDWQSPLDESGQPLPRLGAVSSFGISGTNAHAVIQQSLIPERAPRPRGAYLIVIGARTAEQLTLQVQMLRDFCLSNQQVNIANLSYTLMVGRKHQAHRLACVVSDVQMLISRLNTWLTQGTADEVLTAVIKDSERKEQPSLLSYGNQCIDSSRNENDGSEYRQLLTTIADLFNQGYRLDYSNLFESGQYSRLSLPTYPFAKQRFWVPEAKSTEVAVNAQKDIAKSVDSLLDENCSGFNGVAYRSRFYPSHRVIDNNQLPAWVHLEMARQAFLQQHIQQHTNQQLTNDSLTRELAWRATGVNWAQALVIESETSVQVGLYPQPCSQLGCEIATGTGADKVVWSQGYCQIVTDIQPPTLDLVALQHGTTNELSTNQLAKAQWLFSYKTTEDSATLAQMPKLCQQLAPRLGQKSLTDTTLQQIKVQQVTVYAANCTAGMALWCYVELISAVDDVWTVNASLANDDGQVVLQLDGWQIKPQVVSLKVEPAGQVFLTPHWQLQPIENTDNKQSPSVERHHVLLFGEKVDISSLSSTLSSVLSYKPSVQQFPATDFSTMAVAVFDFIKTIFAAEPQGPLLVQVAIGKDDSWPMLSGIGALLRSAQLENPQLNYQLLWLQSNQDIGTYNADKLMGKLIDNTREPARLIRYQGAERSIWQMQTTDPSINGTKVAPRPFKQGGVYWVTGGSSGLGLLLATHLAAEIADITLVLTGRREQIASIIDNGTATIDYRPLDITDAKGVSALLDDVVTQYGQLNGIIHCAGVNHDNFVIKKSRDEFATVLQPKVTAIEIIDKASAGIKLDMLVLFSSITGVLGNIGQTDYSAANGFLDGFARHRNALVQKGERYGHTVSINWPLWQDGGMNIDQTNKDILFEQYGMGTLTSNAGWQALADAVAMNTSQVMLLCGDVERISETLLPGIAINHMPQDISHEDISHKNIGQKSDHSSKGADEPNDGARVDEAKVDAQQLSEAVTGKLIGLMADVTQLSMADIDAGEALEQYGIDSLMITDLNQRFAKIFGKLSRTLLYQYKTLKALSDYFCKAHPERCASWCELASEASITSKVTSNAPVISASKVAVLEPKEQVTAFNSFDNEQTLLSMASHVRQPMAIIGMSGRFPGADNLKQLWQKLTEGYDAIKEIPASRWAVDEYFYQDKQSAINEGGYYAKWGGFIDDFSDFDPLFFNIAPREAYAMDPQERMFIQSCWSTLEDAGYSKTRLQTVHHGRVGVFAGITKTGYELFGPPLWSQGERVYPFTSFSSVANRVSYLFDFNGPSMPVDTMCSSSLTAVHQACEYLQREECELALVGGVNLYLHPVNFVSLSAQRMLSSDGRCQSFGASGDGFGPGEGVASILIKPLSAASRDGDFIHGLIKGSAINHGGKTNGYTVPNPEAQGTLIAQALKNAQLDARSISYVEAHGTGTALGDPIEVSGLTQAFGEHTNDKAFCALGSLKSNIGHLEAAAGIAGLIKVLLQMRHGQLVPSLHATPSNPNIDFEDTPFVVQQTLAPWQRPQIDGQTVPRRAGLSSFGAGGANAHVILQEYQHAQTSSVNSHINSVQLVVLSGQTPQALDRYAKRLKNALADYQPHQLASLAYTLQIGRQGMDYRLGLVVRSLAELEDKLNHYIDGLDDLNGHSGNRSKGPQISGLYQGEKSEKSVLAVFESDSELQQLLVRWLNNGQPQKVLELWVQGVMVQWDQLWQGPKPLIISAPTYPFERQSYWLAEQIHTDIPRPMNRLHPLVHRRVEDGFVATFKGDESYFSDHVINGEKILPGVAYLEMARAAVTLFVQGSDFEGSIDKSSIELFNIAWLRPIIANGKIQVNIAVDEQLNFDISSTIAGQTVSHCRGGALIIEAAANTETIAVSQIQSRCTLSAMTGAEFYQHYAAIGMDYGPAHQGVVALWLGNVEDEVLAELEIATSEPQDGVCMMPPGLLDSAFQASITVDWGRNNGPEGNKVLMPFAVDKVNIYQPCAGKIWAWVRNSAGSTSLDSVRKLDVTLFDLQGQVCVDICGYAARTPSSLQAGQGKSAQDKSTTQQQSAQTLLMHPSWQAAPLANVSPVSWENPRQLLLCGWSQAQAKQLANGDIHSEAVLIKANETISAYYQRCAEALVKLIQGQITAKIKGKTLIQLVVSDQQPELAGLIGILKTAQLEQPKLVCQLLQLDPNEPANNLATIINDNASSADAQVAYRQQQRYVNQLVSVAGTQITSSAQLPYKQGGVYLITGGAGGLGLIFAREIAQQLGQGHIVLTGRRPHNYAISQIIEQLTSADISVVYQQLDITDKAAVAALVSELKAAHGSINGILHCAGVLKDNYLLEKTSAEIEQVLAPKTLGTLVLDEVTRDEPLDMLVLFSSLAVMGNVGQADYAAANGFMDSFAQHRQTMVAKGQRFGQTLSINWPLWRLEEAFEGAIDGKATGMGVDEATEQRMIERTGLHSMPVKAGLEAFYASINSGLSQVKVLYGNLEAIEQLAQSAARLATTVVIPAPTTKLATANTNDSTVALADKDFRHKVVAFFKQLLAEVLKMPAAQINEKAPLENYGIDSIMVMDLTAKLEKHFGSLSKTLFFEYQRLGELVDYFIDEYHQPLLDILPSDKAKNQAPVMMASKGAIAPVSHSPLSHAAKPIVAKPIVAKPIVAKPIVAKSNAHGTIARPAIEDIAIVGLSGTYAKAADMEQLWANLRDGVDCISEIPTSRWDHALYYSPEPKDNGKDYCRWGGFIDALSAFDPIFFGITPREANYIDPQERLFLQCSYAALEDAGYTKERMKRLYDGNVGVYVGVMYEEYPFLGVQAQAQGQGEVVAVSGSPSSIANRVSYFCDFNGPSMAVDSMCSSSLTTIHLACQSLNNAEVQMALAGGVNISIHPNKYIMLEQGNFSSSKGRCESFGAGGDGYVPGEGVGVVVLKTLTQAQADSDKIYGLIKSSAINHGGKTNGYTVPNPVAQAKLIGEAMAKAQLQPGQIDYIEAHGTGTSLGDPIEIAALNRVYGKAGLALQSCAIGSIKSNIGHCESAAGIAGVSKVLLQLKHEKIAPSLHSTTLNPNIAFDQSPFYVPQQLVDWPRRQANIPRLSCVSSFGAGGANGHVIISEYIEPQTRSSMPAGPYALLLTARTASQLTAKIAQWQHLLATDALAGQSLMDICYTTQVGREPMEHRVALLVSDFAQLRQKLQQLADADLANSEGSKGIDIEGCYFDKVSNHSASLAQFVDDDSFAHTLLQWLQKGELQQLVAVWVKGMDIDWQQMYLNEDVRTVSLPTYPFDDKSYWLKTTQPQMPSQPIRKTALQQTLLEKVWQVADPITEAVLAKEQASGNLIILATEATRALATKIAATIDHNGSHILIAGDTVDFYQGDDGLRCYATLAETLNEQGLLGLIDITALDADYEDTTALEAGKLSLLQSVIRKHRDGGFKLLQLTYQLLTLKQKNLKQAAPNQEIKDSQQTLQGAKMAGLYRMLHSEYRQLQSVTIDTDLLFNDKNDDERLLIQITNEFGASNISDSSEYCYRNGVRYSPTMAKIEVNDDTSTGFNQWQWADDDVVMITGGTGGIGALIVEQLIDCGVKRLLLTGREALPAPEQWSQASGAKVERLFKWQARGVDIVYSNVALDNATELNSVIDSVQGSIVGVVHCAGSASENPAFISKNINDIAAVVQPKIAALNVLHQLFSQHPPRFMLLFSSISAALPSLAVGASDYAMANAYMDYFAAAQQKLGHAYYQSLQWPQWAQVGMAAGSTATKAYHNLGFELIDNNAGLELLTQVVGNGHPSLLPCVVNDAQLQLDNLLGSQLDTQLKDEAGDKPTSVSKVKASAAKAGGNAPSSPSNNTQISDWVHQVFEQQLDLPPEELVANKAFTDFGVDSILVTQVVQHLQRKFTTTLDPALLFEYDSLADLIAYLNTDAMAAHFEFSQPELLQNGHSDQTPIAQVIEPVVDSAVNSTATKSTVTKSTATKETATKATLAHEDIAAIGLACRLPGSANQQAYWKLLCDGKTAIKPLTELRWPQSADESYWGGWVDDIDSFDADYFNIKADDAAIMDPQSRILLEEAVKVIYDAGYELDEISGQKVGVYIGGRAYADKDNMEQILAASNPVLGLGQNYLATNISRFLNLSGPSLVVDSACSSGLTAASIAIAALQSGVIDMAIVGAVSLLQTPYAHQLFAARNILNENNEFHLFDANANGEVLGEGCGVVLLTRRSLAQTQGASVYGIIKALAVNNDGQTLGPGSPSIKAQKAVLTTALQQSGYQAQDIGYIEANGGGSPVIDSIEIKTLSEVYQLKNRQFDNCYLGAIKPNVGHLLLTSGMASLIRCLLSLKHRAIPPFLSAKTPFAHYDFDSSRISFNRQTVPWQPGISGKRVAALNSFADGGTNCHMVLEEFVPDDNYTQQRQPKAAPVFVKSSQQRKEQQRKEQQNANFWGEFIEQSV